MNEFEAGVVLNSPSDAKASSLSLCRLWDVLDLCVHEHVLSTGTGASAGGILIAAAHTAEMLRGARRKPYVSGGIVSEATSISHLLPGKSGSWASV